MVSSSGTMPSNVTRYRTLTITLQIIAVSLGALQAWHFRFDSDADGISYLDIGDKYLQGDWGAAINSYWSPLYSWVLGSILFVLKPSSYWEFPVVHLVNFAIYVGTLFCFAFFLRELIRYNRLTVAKYGGDEDDALPLAAWLALGYALFVSSALSMVSVKSVNPDLMVTGFVYLTTGLLLRIYMGSMKWITFVLFGMVLGANYLAKAAMFPLAFIFLALAILAMGSLRQAFPRILISFCVFGAIAAPFIAAISQAKGRPTVGDSAKYNYAYWVNGKAANVHWRDEPPGVLRHPTRKIFEAPAAFEFGTPIKSTYPPWYDPTYWHEGIRAQFDLKQQLWRLVVNTADYVEIFTRPSILPIAGFLFLCVAANRPRTTAGTIAANWILILPAIATLAMYFVVHVQSRYIGSFIVLLCSGIGCGVRMIRSKELYKAITLASSALFAILAITIAFAPVLALSREIVGLEKQSHVQWEAANGLNRLGIRPGDKVALIGDGYFEYWARLARVQIVAEIPSDNIDRFWSADEATRSEVFDVLAGTGAKAVVTRAVAPRGLMSGWHPIDGQSYYYAHTFRGK